MGRNFFKTNAVLVSAVLVSLVWHAVWLSAIKVSAPDARGKIKFSKVAFLGPILNRGVMEVRVSPRERSFLENRYLSLVQNVSASKGVAAGNKSRNPDDSLSFRDKMIYMVDEAVSGKKIEPPPAMVE